MKVKRVTEAHRERERIRLSKNDIEKRIEDILTWLYAHSAENPDWDKKVSEMHALEIRLSGIDTPIRQSVYADDYRIIAYY